MAKGGNFIHEKYSIFQNYTLDFNPDMVILQYYHNDWRNRRDTRARGKFELWEKGKYELPDRIEKKIDEENLSEDTIVSIIERIEFRKYIKQANKGEEWDKRVKTHLEKIANICEKKNITFLVITWDSRDWQVKGIEEITERHNVPFYDFSDKLPMEPRKYRLPDDHLNSLGYGLVANETYRHLKDMI